MNIFFMISQKICYCPNGLNDSRSQEAKERLYVTVMLLTSLTPCLRFLECASLSRLMQHVFSSGLPPTKVCCPGYVLLTPQPNFFSS